MTSPLLLWASPATVLGEGWESVPNPAGWAWDHGLNIQRREDVFRAEGFDISSLMPPAVVTYYVKIGGSDAADGLTWGTAFATLGVALAKADVDRIYIQGPATFTRLGGWNDVDLTRSCSIIGVGGQVILSTQVVGIVWSLTAGQTYTYEGTRSNVQGVFDRLTLDANGDYTKYSNQSSIATVEATPGSWWQSGTTLYIHQPDNRAPDSDVFVSLIQYNGDCIGNITIYLENLTFEGGIAAFRFRNSLAGQTPKLYAKNCKFKHATNGNGLTLTGITTAILQSCEAAANLADGFNYHILNSVAPRAIEIDCIGRDNGLTASDTDNGSSCHDGGSVIRLNGQYHGCKGPNVVEDGALESWNLGVDAYDSNAGAAGQNADFLCGTSGVMWLDRCRSYGSINGIVAGSGTTIHKRKCSTVVADSGSGTIDSY